MSNSDVLTDDYIERHRSLLGKSSIKKMYRMYTHFNPEYTDYDDNCWCDRRDIKKFKVIFLDWYDNEYNNNNNNDDDN